ncbi:MAG: ABC transporter substrate-binding protein [Acidimicrobiales bacterium]
MNSSQQGPAFSRRHVLRLLGAGGAAVAAVPLLAACGTSRTSKSSASGTPSGSGPGGTTGGASAGSVQDIAKYIGPIDAAHAAKGVSYTFGSVLALSGPGSFYGQVMSKGINLAVKHIAALGGPNFQVVYKDHKSGDPTAGANAVRELGLAKTPIMLASYVDDLGAMFAGSAQYQILSLDGGGGTGLFGNGKPFFWGTRADTPTDPFPGVVEYITKKMPSVKKIAMAEWDLGALNKPINDDLRQQLAKGNLSVATIQPTTIGATDYSTAIQAIKSSNPDLVFVSSYGLDPGYFMKQYVTSGIGKPVIGYEFTPDAAKTAGSAYNDYMFAYDFFDSSNPPNGWSQIFVNEYQKAYGELPDFYAANYYEDTFAVWDLMRRVSAKGGDINSGSQLQDALQADPTLKSVYGGDANTAGILGLDPVEHTPTKRPMGLFSYNSGNIKALAHFDIAGADFSLA